MFWMFLLFFVFVVGIALAAYLAFQVGDETTLGKLQLERLRNSAAVVSAGAALSIPAVIGIASLLNQSATVRQIKETETLQLMNEVDVRISEITGRKADLDEGWPHPFLYDYIIQKTKVRNEVRNLLNAYEFICVGVNKGLLDRDVVKAMRMDALVITFRLDYRSYINRVNADARNANTWSDCVKLAKELEPEVRRNIPQLSDALAKLDEQERKEKEELKRKRDDQRKAAK